MLNDPEMARFLTELQHTPIGRRYRKAWETAQEALKALARMRSESSTNIALREGVRRRYIAASDQASLALGRLTELYGWPADARFKPDFTYQPRGRASPQPRKEP